MYIHLMYIHLFFKKDSKLFFTPMKKALLMRLGLIKTPTESGKISFPARWFPVL